MKNKKKRCISLIEVMIVMFLIAMITGVVAYNYRGSLEQGRAFKTKAAKERVQNILALYRAENPEFEVEQWKEVIHNSPLVHDKKSLLYDGWGKEFQVSADESGEIIVESEKLDAYESKNGSKSYLPNRT